MTIDRYLCLCYTFFVKEKSRTGTFCLQKGVNPYMKNIVITIARYYGSGGRTVGQMLAKDLGIGYYDKEILRLASEDSGINEALFANADEKLRGTQLFRIMRREYHGELIPPEGKDFLSNRNLFNYQAKVIEGLAQEESCVIIGRCADYILKDRENVMSVFVYASPAYCLQQAKLRGANGGRTTMKYVDEINKYRVDYTKYYTGHDWNDVRNYDLCINSGKLGFEGTEQAIKDYIRVRFPDYENPNL